MSYHPVKIDQKFVDKYNSGGPYYVCYPTVGQWSGESSSQQFGDALINEFGGKQMRPMYLYVHFPFCPKLCYYCHCHVVITKNQSRTQSFLNYLFKEIDTLCAFFDQHSIIPNIREIHLGGGSPSVMDPEEMGQLVKNLGKLVDCEKLSEFSLEIDVRTVDYDQVAAYADLGIDRISFGIQDYNLDVQEAINRVQPTDQIEKLLVPELRNRFKGINFDLIFGLPRQTRESFRETIETTLRLSPDRICLYHYNHMPGIHQHQKLIADEDVPIEQDKSMINVEAIQRLEEGGYVRIGLDHFAKQGDDLAKAVQDKNLHRSFIGYTAGRTHDLIGIGPSSISGFGGYYFQSIYSLEKYYEAVDEGVFPTLRGTRQTADQMIREDVILAIMSNFHLDFKEIEDRHGISFNTYFEKELNLLEDLIADEAVELSDRNLVVTPRGRFCVRYVCMIFDQGYQEGKGHVPTSRKDDLLVEVD